MPLRLVDFANLSPDEREAGWKPTPSQLRDGEVVADGTGFLAVKGAR